MQPDDMRAHPKYKAPLLPWPAEDFDEVKTK